MNIAITGHRPNKLGHDYDLITPKVQQIRKDVTKIVTDIQTNTGVEPTLISGMALGIDTMFAEIAISLNLPLICAIPCVGQDSRWPHKSQNKYRKLLSYEKAKHVFVSNGPYSDDVMQKRNMWMVDNCDILIAVWNGTAGGTKNCIDYADRKRPIIYVKI